MPSQLASLLLQESPDAKIKLKF